MDNDRTAGIGHQIKGAVKQGVGKVTNDKQMEAEGVAEKTGGKVQEGVGKGKDAIRDVADSVK